MTENNQLAQALGLKSAPTFILVRDGKEPLGIVGAQPYNVFQGGITQLESNEIKPSPDLKWTKYNNSTLGVSLEYPSSWNLNSTDNSLSDPVNGNIFQIALSNETIPIDIKTLSDEIRAQNSSDMIEPTKMSNYTIDGEPSAEGTRRLIQPNRRRRPPKRNINDA